MKKEDAADPRNSRDANGNRAAAIAALGAVVLGKTTGNALGRDRPALAAAGARPSVPQDPTAG